MEASKGELRFEFTPLPIHPMTFALLIIMGIVATFGVPLWLGGGEGRSMVWLWFLPFLLAGAAAVLAKPSPTRIYSGGIEPSLPLWQQLLHRRSFYPFERIRNIYPKPYYVGGATMSPFAASAGTVEHLGIGLETWGGRELILTFTPSLPGFVRGPSEGYRKAMEHLEEILGERGQPLVQEVHGYSTQEISTMKHEALRPLMAFHVIVLAFFSPIALLPLAFAGLRALGWDGGGPLLGAVVAVGLLPLALMVAITWRRSVRRHRLLREISKFETASS